MSAAEIDCQFTDEIVCPHCGYEYGDSWEVKNESDECPECARMFDIEKHVEISYSTYPMRCRICELPTLGIGIPGKAGGYVCSQNCATASEVQYDLMCQIAATERLKREQR